jgi:hypothetical protein
MLWLPTVFFEELFYLERGHAPRTSRCDRLAVAAVLDVSTGEYPRNWLAVA